MAQQEKIIKLQRIIVIASLGYSLTNFRLELLKQMASNGHQVLAIAPEIGSGTKDTLAEFGIKTESFPLARTGLNPFQDIRTVIALRKIFKKFKPDYILPYTAKPIIYANIAGRLEGIQNRYALFTGLGFAFLDEYPTGKKWLIRQISILLYRISTKGLKGAFTYNPKETEDLRNYKLVPSRTPVIQISGSGVDTSLYAPSIPNVSPIKFLMVSRLLKSKGVHIFVEAVKQLKAQGLHFEAELLGPLDSSPDAITPAEMDECLSNGTIRYLGETNDVRPFLNNSSVMVLPSMYREGIPRSILEAMSTGRAVITSDMPGCAHSIIDGDDGFIVKTGDPIALQRAMAKFIKNPELAIKMGASSREHACRVFDVHKINKTLLTKMGLEKIKLDK